MTDCRKNCACPPVQKHPAKKHFLRRIFNRHAVACGCSVGGGFLVAHAGCIVMAGTGLGLGMATAGSLPLVFGAAAAIGGYALWRGTAGRTSSPRRRTIMAIGTAAGVALSALFHSSAHDAAANKKRDPLDPRTWDVTTCAPQ